MSILTVKVQLKSGILPFVRVFLVHLLRHPDYLHEGVMSSPEFINLEGSWPLATLGPRSALIILPIMLKAKEITAKILQNTSRKPAAAVAGLWSQLCDVEPALPCGASPATWSQPCEPQTACTAQPASHGLQGTSMGTMATPKHPCSPAHCAHAERLNLCQKPAEGREITGGDV